MDCIEKTVNKKKVYDGKILKVFADDALTVDGKPCKREYIHHPGGVCVLAVENGLAYFVEQFRYAISQNYLELPAGKLNENEDPYQAGLRELREETGLIAESLTPMGVIIPSVGYTDEKIYLYVANGLSRGETQFDDDEFLNLKKIPVEKAIEDAENGVLTDAKSVVLLMKYKAFLAKENQSAGKR